MRQFIYTMLVLCGLSVVGGVFPSVGWTAYPQVASEGGGGENSTGATSHTITMPSGVASGDLLLLLWAGSNQTTAPTFSEGSGWTQLYTADSSTVNRTACWWKISDGTEGATETITTSPTGQRSAYTVYRITGHSGKAPEAGTAATAQTTTPDPPSLTPSWGAKDTLWITLLAYYDSNDGTTVSAYPTNYGNGRNDSAAASGDYNMDTGVARRELNATSDDPGTYTISASRAYVVNLIAVEPSAGAVVNKFKIRVIQ